MAFRHNIRHHETGKIAKAVKWLGIAVVIIAIALFAFILYFNGQHVKAPLVKLLSERSGLQFSAGQVEFSPIYPDTVKLHDVSFSKSHIDELYIEYDVKSLLAGKNLSINDLYLRNATINPDDLTLLKNNTLGFDSISIATLRAKHVPLELTKISAKDASFELSEVHVSKGEDLTASSGSGSLADGLIDGISYKDLQGKFTSDNKGIVISDLSLNALGGNISGALEIPNDALPKFTSLSLDKVVLKDPLKLVSKYSFEAPSVNLNNVITVINSKDLLLSGINGNASDLVISNGGMSCNFKGKINEISRPLMQLTLEKSITELTLDPDEVAVKMNGLAFDGEYEFDALLSLTGADDYIKNLKLSSNRLELTPTLYEGFLKDTQTHNLHLNNIELNKVRFLSHIDALPLSAQEITGSISGLCWSFQNGMTPDPASMANLNITDLLYQDLRVNTLVIVSNFTEPLFMLSIPKATFGKSNASMTLSLSRNGGRSFLLGQAHDFELASLNSSLIPHLLSGKVNLDVDLQSSGAKDELVQNLSGTFKLSSDNLLVSAFGLDLINGGRKEDFQLDLSKLLAALDDSDCGMHDLSARIDFGGKHAKYHASSKLSTSAFSLNGDVTLDSLKVLGKAYLVSTPHDSVTLVDISGLVNEPTFDIKALERGIMRPGLFVKALSTQEQAQYEEQRRIEFEEHAQNAEKLLDAVNTLKEEIAVLEKDTTKSSLQNEQQAMSANDQNTNSLSPVKAIEADKAPMKTPSQQDSSSDHK